MKRAIKMVTATGLYLTLAFGVLAQETVNTSTVAGQIECYRFAVEKSHFTKTVALKYCNVSEEAKREIARQDELVAKREREWAKAKAESDAEKRAAEVEHQKRQKAAQQAKVSKEYEGANDEQTKCITIKKVVEHLTIAEARTACGLPK